MIQIQATKAGPSSTDPAERYRTDGGLKRTRTPIVFGIFVATIVLYIKSMFSGGAKPEQPEPASPEESPHSVKLGEPKIVRRGENDDTEYAGEVAEATDGAPARTKFLEVTGSAPLDAIDSRTFDFWDLNARDKWNAFKVSPIIPTPSNDNGTTGKGLGGQASAPSGSSGGGGGSVPSISLGGPSGSSGGPKEPGPKRSDPLPGHDDDDDDDEPATPNRAPRVSGSLYLLDVVGCATVLIGLSDLLRLASDPDGDVLRIYGLHASSGSLTATAGGWTFQGSGIGPVTLTYRITDGQYSVVQTATFQVVPQPPIVGTEGDDNLLGSMCADQISGLGGDDNIDARAGHDVVSGGDGDDHIVGGDGNDRLYGEAGNDVVHGGGGADHIFGGAGNDRLFGEDGNDIIFGDAGNDLISGGAGKDLLVGGAGDDTIQGDAGNDTIEGGEGNDKLEGGAGDDAISGDEGDDTIDGGAGDDALIDGTGSDTVVGGEGDDLVVAAADGAADHYSGGSGFDTIDYSGTQKKVTVDLAARSAHGAEIGEDHVESFEGVQTGSGNDQIKGTDAAEVLKGNAGDDVIAGGGGNDVIEGGAGKDVLHDGAGGDVVDAGDDDDTVVAAADAANDTFDGGDGHDTLDYSSTTEGVDVDLAQGVASGPEAGTDAVAHFEEVTGGSGDDHITGSSGSEVLKGNGGDDVIDAGGGDDVVEGGAGDDVLEGGAGDDVLRDGAGADVVNAGAGDDTVVAAADETSDTFNGGAGHDTLDYSSTTDGVDVDLAQGVATGPETGTDTVAHFEEVVGGCGNDNMTGSSESEVLRGNGGDDVIDAGGGDDVVEGGAGDDVLEGGAGDDVLHDGTGADVVNAGAGDDTVAAAADAANDTFNGGAGHDTLDYSEATEDLDIDLVRGAVSGEDDDWTDTISDFESVAGGEGDDHFRVGTSPTVLRGNGGENVFEFATDGPEHQVLLHEIVDFKMGDRIKMSKYDIFEKVIGKVDKDFERIYGDDVDADDARVRYRLDDSGGFDRTVIEGDMDRDGTYEIEIRLDGAHALVVVENA